MILKILRWIMGYVIFSVDYKDAKLLLNLIARSRLKIWGINRINDLMISKSNFESFKIILNLSKKNNIKINLIKKIGLPFFYEKNKNRNGILVGMIILFLSIKISSLYIWKVNVVGDENLNHQEILNIANQNGVFIGAKKNKLDAKIINQNIMSKISDISWISLNIEGSVANILVKGREKEPKFDDNLPQNIKADCNAKIIRMETFSGTPMVKIGDAVLKGQILVSSLVVDSNGNETNVHANANVWGEVYEEIEDCEDLCQDITIRTGDSKKIIKFKNFALNFWNNLDDSFESEEYENKINFLWFSIPTGFSTETRFETKDVTIYLTENEALFNIRNRIDEKIKSRNLEIINREEEKSIKNNKLYLKSKIKHLKNISLCDK